MQRNGDLRDRNVTPCLPAPPAPKHTVYRRNREAAHGAAESVGLTLGPPGTGRAHDSDRALFPSKAHPHLPRRVGELAEANITQR